MLLIDQVLLIDDDQISNFLTATVLRNSKLFKEIIIYHDGEKALEWLLQQVRTTCQLPDLILLDINISTHNGFSILETLRKIKDCKNQPIIIILSTALNYQDFEQLENFPEVEIYLNKPLQEDCLQFILGKYFSGHRIAN